MALSNAQRQAAYRARQRDIGSETGRISTVVSIDATAGLTRLARWWGVSKREALERLIGEADATAADESREDYAIHPCPDAGYAPRQGFPAPRKRHPDRTPASDTPEPCPYYRAGVSG